jgi:hypothetical protein
MPRVENRRRIMWSLALLIFLAILVVGHASQQGVDKPANEFVLKDSKGMIRALLVITKEDQCEFSLFDQKGRKRIAMAVKSDGTPQFYCADENSKKRVNIGLERDSGKPNFYLRDSSGICRVLVSIGDEIEGGIANITLFNEKGDHRAGLSAFPGKEASLAFNAQEGDRGGVSLGLKDDGAPSLVMYDREGDRFINVGTDPDGSLGCSAYDGNGDPAVRMGVRPSGAPLFEASTPEAKRRPWWIIARPDFVGTTGRSRSSAQWLGKR